MLIAPNNNVASEPADVSSNLRWSEQSCWVLITMIRQEANTKDTLRKPMKGMKLLSHRFERMLKSFELMVGRRCKVEKEDVMATRSWRRSSRC